MTYYELLGISRDADAYQLKKAYKKAALKHHPDKGGDEETFKEVAIAFETLSDESKRLNYDRQLPYSFPGTSGFGDSSSLLNFIMYWSSCWRMTRTIATSSTPSRT